MSHLDHILVNKNMQYGNLIEDKPFYDHSIFLKLNFTKVSRTNFIGGKELVD